MSEPQTMADQLRDYLAWAGKRFAGIPQPNVVDRVEAEAVTRWLASEDAERRLKAAWHKAFHRHLGDCLYTEPVGPLLAALRAAPVEGDADFDATATDYRRGSPQYNPALPADIGVVVPEGDVEISRAADAPTALRADDASSRARQRDAGWWLGEAEVKEVLDSALRADDE